MQLDNRDEFLSEAFPLVLSALNSVREVWSTPETEAMYELLNKWDYHMPITSVSTSIYHVFEHNFQ